MEFKKLTNQILKSGLVLGLGLGLANCSGSSTTSTSDDSSTSLDVSSLQSIPSLSDIVSSSSSTDSNLSLFKAAVSGTPPNLIDITSSTADTLFWNGLIEDITDNGATGDDIEAFWDGEGACRMAQDVGFSFENIEQAGTSVCYIKNAPTATSGVSIVSGDITDAEEVFTPTAETRVVRVEVTGEDSGEENEGPSSQDIYIRVYGTDSTEGAAGFAVDLWFCETDSTGEPNGYEQVRVVESTGVMTQTSIDTQRGGNFVSEFTGMLTVDDDGNPIFDPEEEQVVTFTYESEEFGVFKGYVNVQDGSMISKGYHNWTYDSEEQTRKTYVLSEFSGSSLATLKFLQAGYANQWNFGEDSQTDTFYGAAEFQDTYYAATTDSDLYDSVLNYDFTSDTFFTATLETDSTLLAAVSDYSCGVTPDSVVSMDMSDETLQDEVVSLCDSHIDNGMNFCDDDSIETARQAIFSAE